MRLANEEITIRLEHEVIRLRPTLRAACRLHRRHGGFDAIAKGIGEGNVTIMADLVREGSVIYTDFPDALESIARMPLRSGIEALSAPLFAFTMALVGMDDEAEEGEPKGKPVPFEEYHAQLYRIATGWLGWTPAQAWEASPAEITEAYKGRMDLLRAVFGGKPAENETPQFESDAESWSAGIAKLRAITGPR